MSEQIDEMHVLCGFKDFSENSQGRKPQSWGQRLRKEQELRVSGPRLEDTELLMVRWERISHGGGREEEKAKRTGMARSHRRGTMWSGQ